MTDIPKNKPDNYPFGEFDASKWAAEFMQMVVRRGRPIDEDLMWTWFANAIMTGYDYAKNDEEIS